MISFYLSSFFSLPNLSGRRLDVYHTSTHGVALVQIYNACMKCAARRSLKIQDAKKSPFWHHRTTLSGCIFAAKACIQNPKKKLVKRPTINGWDLLASLGHSCKFQRVLRLGSVTARHLAVGVSQTLRHWTEGATYIRQGDHHVGHWPTFLVLTSLWSPYAWIGRPYIFSSCFFFFFVLSSSFFLA